MNTLRSAQTEKAAMHSMHSMHYFLAEKCIEKLKSASKCMKKFTNALYKILIINVIMVKVHKVHANSSYYSHA